MKEQEIKIEDLVGKTVYFPYYNFNYNSFSPKQNQSCEKLTVEEYYKTNDLLVEQRDFHNDYNQLLRDYIKKIEKFKDGMEFGFMRNIFNSLNSFRNNDIIYLPDVELVSDDTYNIINISKNYPKPISRIITISEFNTRWFLDEESAIKAIKEQREFKYIQEED